jgi:hypothetical protein
MSNLYDVIRAKLLYGVVVDTVVPPRPTPLYNTKLTIGVSATHWVSRTVVAVMPYLGVYNLYKPALLLEYGVVLEPQEFVKGVKRLSYEVVNKTELARWDELFATRYAKNGKPMCSSCGDPFNNAEGLTPNANGGWDCEPCVNGTRYDDYDDYDDHYDDHYDEDE